MKTPRRSVWLAVLCVLTASDDVGSASNDCTDKILVTVPSPDGAWRADVDQSVCDLGLSSAATNEVRVFSMDGAAGPTAVLGLDAHGDPDDVPRIAWTDPRRLEVTVPNLASLGEVARRVGPVGVDVVFDPPDPAARAAWLRQVQQDQADARGK